MVMHYRFFALVASTLVACAWVSTAGATNAQAVFNVPGNQTCRSLSPDDDIKEIKVEWPSEGPADGPLGQFIDFQVNRHNELSWMVDGLPVNYVILTGKNRRGGATVYSYGSAPGARSDSGLVVSPGKRNEGARIKKLRFCYGLSEESELPPPLVENLGDCAELAANGGIDGTIVQMCPHPDIEPDDPKNERIILSFNPNKANFGMVLCTCNLNDKDPHTPDSVFAQCDPDASLGENDSDSDSEKQVRGRPCPSGNPIQRVPINITGVEDPNSFLCFALGGGRSCFFHDSK